MARPVLPHHERLPRFHVHALCQRLYERAKCMMEEHRFDEAGAHLDYCASTLESVGIEPSTFRSWSVYRRQCDVHAALVRDGVVDGRDGDGLVLMLRDILGHHVALRTVHRYADRLRHDGLDARATLRATPRAALYERLRALGVAEGHTHRIVCDIHGDMTPWEACFGFVERALQVSQAASKTATSVRKSLGPAAKKTNREEDDADDARRTPDDAEATGATDD